MLNTQAHKAFYESCLKHDLTYEYSDDMRVWRKGTGTLNDCKALAFDLPIADAIAIWNSVVDRKVKPEVAPEFYWKLPTLKAA